MISYQSADDEVNGTSTMHHTIWFSCHLFCYTAIRRPV